MKIKLVAPIFGFEKIDEVTFEVIDEFFAKVESDEISFTLIDPAKVREYSFDIPLYYKDLLKLNSAQEASVYNVVVVNSDITKSTINFAAPIIVNKKEQLLAQIALDEIKYQAFGLAEPISDYL
ncbi:MAG: flagellar assembly protein FliW [Epsilonproteobacteria bacterium]|nr:flagellar assembly protein FliW [Campylobacterota bacterium]